MLRKLALLLALIAVAPFAAMSQAGGTASPGTSSGSSATSQGPVINVTNPAYSGGASSALVDNNAAFTAAFAASNTTSTATGAIIPAPHTAPQTSLIVSSTTMQFNFTMSKGDTVYVFIQDSNARAFTITTDGGTTFTQLGTATNSAGGGQLQVFRSTIGGALQSSLMTVAQGGAAESYTVAAVALANVLSDVLGTPVTGSSVSPTISQTTTAANSFVLGSCVWWNNATIALTSTAGTLLTNSGATVTNLGLALWGTAKPTLSSQSSSGTLGSTAAWACQSVEVKSGGTNTYIPNVFIPAGYYYYSGGINPTISTTITCAPGAYLNYTGSAHAVDLGPAGLSFITAHHLPYIVDGCSFVGGTNMTQGIYMQPFIESVGIRNSLFYNFGNATSYMIASSNDNWDIEVGPQNRFLTDDYQPRKVFIENLNHINGNSFGRIHDNQIWCVQGYQNLGCSAAQAATAITFDGSSNRFYHNNIMFMNPAVLFFCSNTPCVNNQADQNQIEGPASGVYNIFQFGGGTLVGTLITQNTVNMHGTTGSVIAPFDGAALLTGSRVNFNTIENMPLATAFTGQNNLVGQGGNVSFSNNCSVAFTPMLPCASMHTIAGNITPWSPDYYLSCTMVAGTCTATFSQTYAVAPRCPNATWSGAGTLTGIVKAVPSTTNVVVTSSVAGDTAAMSIGCSASDGQ